LAESAMLIGVLPAPTAYSPVSGNPTYAKERQTTVLSRMVKNNAITEEQKTAALAAKLSYAPAHDPLNNGAPHFAEMVLNELYKRYGEEKVTRSGYQISTGLDLAWQKDAQAAVDKQLPIIQAGNGSNASVVAIDPKSGEVRALVGSISWDNKEFGKVNMATTPRQPGSSFKPIYYTEAMRQRLITPATILKDEPTSWGSYQPQNFDFRFRGNITVRNALAQSLNIPAVKVMEKLGVNDSIQAARRLGITTLKDSNNYGLSLALGAAEVKLLEMTNAYAAFAHEGTNFSPTLITSIKDKYGDEIFTTDRKQKEGTSKAAAFLISNILSDNTARAPTFGSNLNVYGRDVAVKTGTTDDARDAWTIGYTPQVVVGVWVGNNDNQVMHLGGSGMAGPIWMNTLTAILNGAENQPFEKPSNVEQVLICANGKRASRQAAGVFADYFISGTEPTERCDLPEVPQQQTSPRPRQQEPEEQTPVQQEPVTPDPVEPEVPEEEENPPTDNDSGSSGGNNGTGNNSGTNNP
jgi:membrane peptidoglycan carboxypeptidase